MSSRDSFAFSRTRVVAGIGAVSMITGSLAATAKVWNRRPGPEPELAGALLGHDQDRRRPVGDLRRGRRGDQAVLDEARGAGRPASRRWSRPGPPRRRSAVPRRPDRPRRCRPPATLFSIRARRVASGTISCSNRPSEMARAARSCDRARSGPSPLGRSPSGGRSPRRQRPWWMKSNAVVHGRARRPRPGPWSVVEPIGTRLIGLDARRR